MPEALDIDPAAAVRLCLASHQRLLAALEDLTDLDVGRPSRLPGWTVGHVLTHLARNADGQDQRLRGALRGEEVPRYPGGPEQRNADIEAGASRSAIEIVADLAAAQGRLERTWADSAAAGWPHADLLAGDSWPTTAGPVRRLREVEVHHVDLGRGYEPSDWPEEYVSWELPALLATVPQRVRPQGARDLVVWLTGRSEVPTALELDPW